MPFEIITPKDLDQRGSQLSVQLSNDCVKNVFKELEKRGIIVNIHIEINFFRLE